MKKREIFLVQIIIMICGLYAPGHAQDTIVTSVFGNGISISQSGNHRLSATLGQPLIGAGKNETITIFGGFWNLITEITTSTKQINEISLPQEFSLEQNYPNPFNPNTTISYSIPKTSLVTLKVYDILGKEVASLVNEEKSAGRYKVNFKAGRLSSGVFFYRIQAGSYTETKKFILMK